MGFWWNKRGKRLLSISSQMSHNLRVWALKKRVMVCGGLLRPEWKRRLMMAISIHNVMLSVLLWWKWILLENKVWYDYLQQALWWSLWSSLSLKSFWKENEYFLFTKKVLKLLNWSKVIVDSTKKTIFQINAFIFFYFLLINKSWKKYHDFHKHIKQLSLYWL